MFNVANDYQKFPLLSSDLENVLTKHFPKIQKLPRTDVLQNRCSKFIRLKICIFIKKETATYVFSGAQPLGKTGGHSSLPPPTSVLEPNKVQLFKFQISRILLFMCVQKLCGREISKFLPCVLQVLENLQHLFIFSNYIGKIDHFTLDLLKRSDSKHQTF